ncbi:hypothetical protein A3K63_04550 [Candidatus Micrarchaeota archaeon RBG_16_49_10]|nr:MAG: hypothetical protein A3K63_04550 [Candidatus Micrarchaeota archaeon RBG_16_49_10]
MNGVTLTYKITADPEIIAQVERYMESLRLEGIVDSVDMAIIGHGSATHPLTFKLLDPTLKNGVEIYLRQYGAIQ